MKSWDFLNSTVSASTGLNILAEDSREIASLILSEKKNSSLGCPRGGVGVTWG